MRLGGLQSPATEERLIQLVYELLDAHHDTMELEAEHRDRSWRWRAHLDYVRALQRTGRELLAELAADPAPAADPGNGWR